MLARLFSLTIPITFFCLGFCGCDSTIRISGQVTFEGKPVEKGQIIFLPADGQGPISGAPILKGKYALNNLSPGSKKVQISSSRAIGPPVKNLEEMAKKKGKDEEPAEIEQDPNAIPANAVGNNATVEIKGSQSNLDFDLRIP